MLLYFEYRSHRYAMITVTAVKLILTDIYIHIAGKTDKMCGSAILGS